MFTVKLATGEGFPVTVAEQRLFGSEGSGQSMLTLQLEAAPADHDLDWYLEKPRVPGVLDQAQVLCENGAVGFTAEGYAKISTAAMRLLPSSKRKFSLSLVRA